MAKLEIINGVEVFTVSRQQVDCIEANTFDLTWLHTGGFMVLKRENLSENSAILFERIGVKPTTDYYIIALDEARKMLGRYDRVILDHELAHCQYRHLDGITITTAEGVSNNVAFELEADAYAAKIHGKKAVLNALRRTVLVLAITANRHFGKNKPIRSSARHISGFGTGWDARLQALK